MMEGITVLNQYEAYISGPGFSVLGVMWAIVTFVLIVAVIFLLIKRDNGVLFLILIAMITSVITYICFSTGNPKYESYVRYDVIIDESVSFTEFAERYKIIEQKGKIYTIRDRDN